MQPTPDSDALIKQIGIALIRSAPEGWQLIRTEFRATGRYYELSAEVTDGDGKAGAWTASQDIALMFARLRSAMHSVPGGTWFNARYQVEQPSHYNVEFDRAEPRWRTQPPLQALRDELRYFPRAEEDVPEWLVMRISGLPGERERAERRFRVARIFDAQGPAGRPTVNRPPVPEHEREQLRQYLDGAPLVLPVRGNDVDRLSADGRTSVPVAFHSDGTWVWPAAVNYYFARYGLPPESDLVEHARSLGFTVPDVDEATSEAAAQTITGGGRQQDQAVRQGAAPPPGSQGAGEAPTDRLRRRLDELGVPREVYRIGEPAPDVWHLTPGGDGWRVGWSTGSTPAPTRFTDEHDAASFLLGKVVLGGGRPAAPAPSAASAPQPQAHPIEPEPAPPRPAEPEPAQQAEPAGAAPPEPEPEPFPAAPVAGTAAAAAASEPAESPLAPPAGAFPADVEPVTGYATDAPAGGAALSVDSDGQQPPAPGADPDDEKPDDEPAEQPRAHWEPDIERGAAPEAIEVGGADHREPADAGEPWLLADEVATAGGPEPDSAAAGGRHEAAGGPVQDTQAPAAPGPSAQPAPENQPESAQPAPENAAPSGSPSELWRQWRLSDDPPAELFRGKSLETLPAGTEVDRYGAADGNLTYVRDTPFEQRSLPQEWAERPLHSYRLRAPVDAVAGTAVPWFDQPGGGTGYLLPRSVADLLADGVLDEPGA